LFSPTHRALANGDLLVGRRLQVTTDPLVVVYLVLGSSTLLKMVDISVFVGSFDEREFDGLTEACDKLVEGFPLQELPSLGFAFFPTAPFVTKKGYEKLQQLVRERFATGGLDDSGC